MYSFFVRVLKGFITKNLQNTTKYTLHLFPMAKVVKITKNIFFLKGKERNTEIQTHFQWKRAKIKLWVAERSVSFECSPNLPCLYWNIYKIWLRYCGWGFENAERDTTQLTLLKNIAKCSVFENLTLYNFSY